MVLLKICIYKMISKNIMWVPLKKNKTLPWTNILDVIYNMSFSSLKLQKKNYLQEEQKFLVTFSFALKFTHLRIVIKRNNTKYSYFPKVSPILQFKFSSMKVLCSHSYITCYSLSTLPCKHFLAKCSCDSFISWWGVGVYRLIL